MDTKSQKGPAPPYVAYKTFKNFIDSLKVAMPGRIDRSVLHTMSGGTQSHMMHALRALDLITEHGIPKDSFRELVSAEGEDRKRHIQGALRIGYPFLFSGSIDLATGSGKQLLEQFNVVSLSGDTIRKSITFFLSAAKDSGIKLSPYFEKIQSRSGATPKRNTGGNGQSANPPSGEKAPQAGATDESKGKPKVSKETTTREPPADNWVELLLSKFPSFDPAWPDEVKSKWFDAFEKLMRSRT